MNLIPTIAIIGGGPAGLMAADMLTGAAVTVFDAMPSVGRKFLMAGKGGMNITHSEPLADFIARYRHRSDNLAPLLSAFGPLELREWLKQLGVDTFVGTSGRVFPTDMKAAPLLRAWLHRLKASGIKFQTRHRWVGWSEDDGLHFVTPQGEKIVHCDATIFALGGGSWARLGSDGTWVELFSQHGITVSPLRPANCGFDTSWSDHFREKYAGAPVKTVSITFIDAHGNSHRQMGEFVITATGIEGSLIYALSAELRDTILDQGSVEIFLDLAPARSGEQLATALAKNRGSKSLANHLRSRVGIDGVKAGLLRELGHTQMQNPDSLAQILKALPLRLSGIRPLDDAISSAGGIPFETLDEKMMLKDFPGLFCAGEMLDWEAPTGGYLLTACFASGRAAGLGARAWLGMAEK